MHTYLALQAPCAPSSDEIILTDIPHVWQEYDEFSACESMLTRMLHVHCWACAQRKECHCSNVIGQRESAFRPRFAIVAPEYFTDTDIYQLQHCQSTIHRYHRSEINLNLE